MKRLIYLSRETTDFGLLRLILWKSKILAIARVRRIREDGEEVDGEVDNEETVEEGNEREEEEGDEEGEEEEGEREDKLGATSKKKDMNVAMYIPINVPDKRKRKNQRYMNAVECFDNNHDSGKIT